MMPTYLLGLTAFAMGVVGNLTGSLGAVFWGVILSILACVVAVTNPLGAREATAVDGGGLA